MRKEPLNILIFDTETTGLPESLDIPPSDYARWPRLVQLAYIQWRYLDGRAVPVAIRSQIVKPEGFTISDEMVAIHGITNERAIGKGHDIVEVLNDFADELSAADVVVAHNIKFDRGIILSEFARKGHNESLLFELNHQICTRDQTRDICNIEKDGKIKYPKLSELFRFCFGHDFVGAHDAFNDVTALSQCFFHLADKLLPEEVR